jgi:hypothetical protein
MLACIDDKGGMVRICWPDIDYPQHIDTLMTGITCPGFGKELPGCILQTGR